MNEIGEALGTASEGGMFARAVSRKEGSITQPASDAGGDCRNCGSALLGSYCHACGQKAQIHRSITGIMHDLLHGVLHLDGKLWNTLPLLVWRPGRLTREYIEGKRARHVSPMSMFLFSVFLMFAVFQALGITAPSDIAAGTSIKAGIERTSSQLRSERVRKQERLAELPAASPKRAKTEQDIANIDEALAAMNKSSQSSLGDTVDMNVNLTGIKSIDDGLLKKWKEHPELMLYKLQNNSYKFSWLLIPLSIPFVWLLFLWRRQYKAYDHAVFVTYSLSFMSLLFIVLSVLTVSGILGFWAFAALLVVPPIHLYKQLRGTYALSRFSAFWRLLALSLFIWIVVILFLQALLVLGAF
jgi:Protein of unknown function (DUF3667)